jgi:hypothetical protein
MSVFLILILEENFQEKKKNCLKHWLFECPVMMYSKNRSTTKREGMYC